jgi:hypothetical protein
MASEIERIGIDAIDKRDGLTLWHGPGSDRFVRGDIHSDEGELIVRTFGTAVEVVVHDVIASHVVHDTNALTGYWAHAFEGTLIRLFHHDNKWHICTHKRLDAHNSFWGCRSQENFKQFDTYHSFGDMFDAAWASSYDLLNTKYVYCILLLPLESTRIVCVAAPKPMILHVATFERGTGVMLAPSPDTDIPGVVRPSHLPFQSMHVNEVLRAIDGMSISYYQGAIFTEIGTGSQVKVYSSAYRAAMRLRGNERDVVKRYMQLRLDRTFYDQYLALYPLYFDDFALREIVIISTARRIFDTFLATYCNVVDARKHGPLNGFERHIMKDLRRWQTESRAANRVTLRHVVLEVSTQDPIRLHAHCMRFEERRRHAIARRSSGATSYRDAVTRPVTVMRRNDAPVDRRRFVTAAASEDDGEE